MNLDTLINAALDRGYPQPSGTPDWDDVLARVPHLDVGAPSRRRVRRPLIALAAALFIAVAVALALVAPWSARPSLVQQALAAIDKGRYVHAVFESRSPTTWWLDLRSGREHPLLSRVEWVYDTKSGAYDARALSGGVVFDVGATRPDQAVSRFATGYRTALRRGEARGIGAAVVRGEPAAVLRFSIRDSDGRLVADEDVAVSNSSHVPVEVTYRRVDAHGAPVARPVVYRVLSIDSSESRTALPRASVAPVVTGSATPIRPLREREASAALGHAPLWAGRTIGGAALATIELERVTTQRVGSFRTMSRSLGLRFEYGGSRGAVTIEEAAKAERGYGFWTAELGTGGPLPPAGEAALSCGGCGSSAHTMWQAQLRAKDLYLTIRSTRRDLVVAAARALVVMPSR
jgi:hypothetical protein